MNSEDTRPTTPLDDIYAALLREQPENDILWSRIIERAQMVARARDAGILEVDLHQVDGGGEEGTR